MTETTGPATGLDDVDDVDDVLRLLDGLDGRPVGEHVEIFDQAHRDLRRVLDAG